MNVKCSINVDFLRSWIIMMLRPVNIELTDLSFLHLLEIKQVFRFFSMHSHSFYPMMLMMIFNEELTILSVMPGRIVKVLTVKI